MPQVKSICKEQIEQICKEQICKEHFDGVAMVSLLALILANIFMGYHKKGWIRDYNYGGLLYYKKYADDIFAVFETKDHAVSF